MSLDEEEGISVIDLGHIRCRYGMVKNPRVEADKQTK